MGASDGLTDEMKCSREVVYEMTSVTAFAVLSRSRAFSARPGTTSSLIDVGSLGNKLWRPPH